LRCARLAIEPRLRRREARKTRNRGPEIDRFPLRVEAGSLQLFNPREQISTKRATRSKRFDLAGQLKATSAVGTAIVVTRSPCLIKLG
jgi:hypothetical protein